MENSTVYVHKERVVFCMCSWHGQLNENLDETNERNAQHGLEWTDNLASTMSECEDTVTTNSPLRQQTGQWFA